MPHHRLRDLPPEKFRTRASCRNRHRRDTEVGCLSAPPPPPPSTNLNGSTAARFGVLSEIFVQGPYRRPARAGSRFRPDRVLVTRWCWPPPTPAAETTQCAAPCSMPCGRGSANASRGSCIRIAGRLPGVRPARVGLLEADERDAVRCSLPGEQISSHAGVCTSFQVTHELDPWARLYVERNPTSRSISVDADRRTA